LARQYAHSIYSNKNLGVIRIRAFAMIDFVVVMHVAHH